MTKKTIVLGIETSCDDTGISILEVKGKNFKVLANIVSSQTAIHSPYGGVFPMLAKREHMKNLPIVLAKALKKAGMKIDPVRGREGSQRPSASNGVDMIAVTSGPGLEPALWTGIVFAKELSKKWGVPVIPVNHMEGHILSVIANKKTFSLPKWKFPVLSLLVSGGHTELVLSESFLKYKKIGQTLDDAAGEAFDKVARMMELPYPGGPEISRLAELARKAPLLDKEGVGGGNSKNHHLALKGTPPQKGGEEIKLPRPMMYTKNFDFSFSGLKTAVLYLIRDLKKEHSNILQNDKMKMAIAKEFEDAVVETLTHKTMKAIEKYGAKTLIVAGGVSANRHLRKTLTAAAKQHGIKPIFPTGSLSADNALMIALTGYFRRANTKKNFRADGGMSL